MKPEPGLFVRVGDEVRGPYRVEQLRQLAEVGVIVPATEAATAPAGPWAKLETITDAAAVFPPRVELGFKPTEFAKDNHEATPPVDLREMIAAANRPVAPKAAAEAMARAEAAGALITSDAPNEVAEMVRAVQQREAQFAPPLPLPKKRPLSRRFMLCLVLAVAGNAVLAAIPLFYGATRDEASMLIVTAWAVIYNGGLTMVYFALPRE